MDDLEDCDFYHTMDIPGHGTTRGYWDLRQNLTPYLGRVSFEGKSVLEIGPADGFVSFEMERRGARVVAVDLPVGVLRGDVFPIPEASYESMSLEKKRRAFWFAHRAARSKVELIECHVSDLDPSVKGFDIALVGNVMQHLKDPVGMLINISDRADTIIITEADWTNGALDDRPAMELATPAIQRGDVWAWFILSPKLVEDVLSLRGFSIVARDIHHQVYSPRRDGDGPAIRHYTITARRCC